MCPEFHYFLVQSFLPGNHPTVQPKAINMYRKLASKNKCRILHWKLNEVLSDYAIVLSNSSSILYLDHKHSFQDFNNKLLEILKYSFYFEENCSR